MTSNNRAPPQLIFDDGSRIMMEESSNVTPSSAAAEGAEAGTGTSTMSEMNPRGTTSVEIYYEIDRICNEIVAIWKKKVRMMMTTTNTKTKTKLSSNNNGKDEDESENARTTKTTQQKFHCRIALQFPDESLSDSPEVCWLLEDALAEKEIFQQATTLSSTSCTSSFLVFCLGDTTVGSCCPDEVAAFHLKADILIHFGHACLSPTETLPVIYSFGNLQIDVPTTVQTILQKINDENEAKPQHGEDDEDNNNNNSVQRKKVLLLYQVGYQYAIDDIQTQLSEQGEILVIAGEIPSLPSKDWQMNDSDHFNSDNNNDNRGQQQTTTTGTDTTSAMGCCREGGVGNDTNCGISTSSTIEPTTTNTSSEVKPKKAGQEMTNDKSSSSTTTLTIGGLELPESITKWEQLSDFIVLYIGDVEESTSNRQRQYVHMMLQFFSLPAEHQPTSYWIYSPVAQTLATADDESSMTASIRRQLKRRFFLTQKARDASVFGILVSNLSQQHLIQVVQSIQYRIQNDIIITKNGTTTTTTKSDRACYTFAVGKINPAKLANFAEIECFVLVACEEHSLLDNEREYHIPVITPLELDIALGNKQWGGQVYTLNCQDVLSSLSSPQNDKKNGTEDDDGTKEEGDENDEEIEDDDDDDAPYFSLITGTYVQRNKVDGSTGKNNNNNDDESATEATLDLSTLPGQGQVMVHQSQAAEFLKQREYQGLTTSAGQTKVEAAIPGQHGIASDYNGS